MKTPVINLVERLAAQDADPVMGIKLAHLAGGEDSALFGAEIAPGVALKAHVHREGDEIYQILSGQGCMCLGVFREGLPLVWQEVFAVRAGDSFQVQPGQAHQIQNTGPEPLTVLFIAPPTHLTTDRQLLELVP